jgi:two-component system chemotaxis response regulator CheB
MDPIRVMVVDDSVIIRKIVRDALSAEPGIEVVGTARNGRLALAKIDQLKPDLITMDIEMPEVNGIEAVRAIRVRHRSLPIIMFCAATDRGATAALDALAVGADDYVPKPADVGGVVQATARIREQLVPRIKGLTGRTGLVTGPPGPTSPLVRPSARPWRRVPDEPPALLVIASSTGGPEALTTVLPALPASLPVPVLLVQHMPPVFTRQFAARLDRLCALKVREATDGAALAPGEVHVAPGDHHLTVRGVSQRARLALDQAPPENFCRPSADRLFRSASTAFGGAVLAVVLTGMGSDGRAGAEQIRAAGGVVLAQDEATSVVWGMPGTIVEAGLADEVVPLGQMAEAILRRTAAVGRRAVPPRAGGGVQWR